MRFYSAKRFFCAIDRRCASIVLSTNTLLYSCNSRSQLRYSQIYLIFQFIIHFDDKLCKKRLLNVSLKIRSKILFHCVHLKNFELRAISKQIIFFFAISTFSRIRRVFRIACEQLNKKNVISLIIVKSRRYCQIAKLATNVIR